MARAQFSLSVAYLAKGLRYMREVRRAIEAYWYATMEDPEAAALEVRRVASAVNILDEAVFLHAFGDDYRRHRARDPLGKVVMGLELIRNCEEHSPALFEGLLVPGAHFGVPMHMAPTRMRVVYDWAQYVDMPADYVNIDPEATEKQKRARGEAQDAYRKEVQGRPVVVTLFDAVRFFQSLDPQLIAENPPIVRWAFAESAELESAVEVPVTDPRLESPHAHLVYRPMGLDNYEVFLLDIVCRNSDQRSAQWPAWDKAVRDRKTGLVRQAKDRNPPGGWREVRHLLIENGKVIGYSGIGDGVDLLGEQWVERTRQVANDVNRGYPYFVRAGDVEVPLQRTGNQSVAAVLDGRDLLSELREPVEKPGMDLRWLKLLEDNPDLYLATRRAAPDA
ncbi:MULTISPECIES: hypothetical protein [unclassified Streptomyces]|uniref:hypothetical protein n=1 Tax=unclassified Streptomyces TaxID=2593676 RepID=UPI0016553B85|nr:hypothetical protein [Streptomyces sp. CB02980]MCB8902069.1 hypothetical protein [Streptomyces sp. CB02980]